MKCTTRDGRERFLVDANNQRQRGVFRSKIEYKEEGRFGRFYCKGGRREVGDMLFLSPSSFHFQKIMRVKLLAARPLRRTALPLWKPSGLSEADSFKGNIARTFCFVRLNQHLIGQKKPKNRQNHGDGLQVRPILTKQSVHIGVKLACFSLLKNPTVNPQTAIICITVL